MEIIVCIKQVPGTTDVKINSKTGTLIREGIESIINPDDRHAIEAAVSLKEKTGGNVTVMTMGPPQAEDALREALAMGCDKAVLLCDKKFAGADTLATSYTLSLAVKKLGKFDVIFAGKQAADGDTAQVGPQLAEFLDIPQVTYGMKLVPGDNCLEVHRAALDAVEVLKVPVPVLITVVKEMNTPRYASVPGIFDAYSGEEDFIVFTADDIAADISRTGLDGSPTWVRKTFTPPKKGSGEIFKGAPKEAAKTLVGKLVESNRL